MYGSKEKQKVLLIEDDKVLADALILSLRAVGYDTEVAYNGNEGLNSIQNNLPNLVLLDIDLPGINGYEILEQLEKDGLLPNLPVIVISNTGQVVNMERLKLFGIRDAIIKVNVSPTEIVEKVIACISAKTVLDNSLNNADESDQIYDTKKSLSIENSNAQINNNLQPTILLVEDDSFLSSFLETKFKDRDFHVVVVDSVKAAREVLQHKKINLICLDLLLPEENGYALLEELKKSGRLYETPVIIISNLGQKEEIEKGKSFGAVDYIIKAHTTPGEIVNRVEQQLKQAILSK